MFQKWSGRPFSVNQFSRKWSGWPFSEHEAFAKWSGGPLCEKAVFAKWLVAAVALTFSLFLTKLQQRKQAVAAATSRFFRNGWAPRVLKKHVTKIVKSKDKENHLISEKGLPGTPPKIIKNTFLGGPNMHTYNEILIFSAWGGSWEAKERFQKKHVFYDDKLRIAYVKIV